jgi:hypothetical protein
MEQPDNQSNQPDPNPPFHDEGVLDFDLASKIKLAGHQWVQNGFYIVCKSCPLRHASYIGPDWWLIGIDDKGLPKFKKVC